MDYMSDKYTFSSNQMERQLHNMAHTFWVLYGATDVVPGTVGGDGGQPDFVGQRDSQVWYGVGHQHPLFWFFTPEIDLLQQHVLLVLETKNKLNTKQS